MRPAPAARPAAATRIHQAWRLSARKPGRTAEPGRWSLVVARIEIRDDPGDAVGGNAVRPHGDAVRVGNRHLPLGGRLRRPEPLPEPGEAIRQHGGQAADGDADKQNLEHGPISEGKGKTPGPTWSRAEAVQLRLMAL